MDDADNIVDRGGGCIVRMNEAEGFGVEMLARDVPVDREIVRRLSWKCVYV